MDFRMLYLEEVAKYFDHWTNTATTSLCRDGAPLSWTDHPERFRAIQGSLRESGIQEEIVESVMKEILFGMINSFLTILDGATELAEQGRVRIVDESGMSLGEALHDDFALHLIQTGRMQ